MAALQTTAQVAAVPTVPQRILRFASYGDQSSGFVELAGNGAGKQPARAANALSRQVVGLGRATFATAVLCIARSSRKKKITVPTRRHAESSGSSTSVSSTRAAKSPQGQQSANGGNINPELGGAAAVRRAARMDEYRRMKRESLVDAALMGVAGCLIALLSYGAAAAQGLILGAAAGSAYLALLHRDVDALGTPGDPTPLGTINPRRVVRLLIPVLLLFALAALTAFTVGPETWLANLQWQPGSNFSGFVGPPSLLYGALLGYILPTLAMQLRGLMRAVPEVRDLVTAFPGSVGVAMKLSKDEERKKQQKAAAAANARDPDTEVIPVLLVSGPRCVGKSTVVKRLVDADPRFGEPPWIATALGSAVGGHEQKLVSQDEFSHLQQSGGLVVSYKPYGEDGETIAVGLTAASILNAATKKGACVLDVDPPTARALLGCDWSRALSAAAPSRKIELCLVTVWVSLPSLDAIVERNRDRLQASLNNTSVVERQLAPLRAQATSDIEWALTSGGFDFTVINEDVDKAAAEVLGASRYCFE